MTELTQAQKLIVRKLAEEEKASPTDLYENYEGLNSAYSTRKSLANGLRKVADKGVVKRERKGKTYVYELTKQGQNLIQEIRKRERNRKKEETDIFDYEDGVEEFIKFYETTEYGKDQIAKVGVGRNFVKLDYKKLEKFNVELADDLLTDPDRVLNACNEAVNTLPEVTETVNVRVENVSDIEVQTISSLSAKDMNQLITVEGVIQSVSKPGSVLVEGIFECSQCGERYERDLRDKNKVTSPFKCSCGSKKFEKVKEKHETVRYVRIKEKPDQRSRNKIVAILQGDLADDESKNLKAIGSGVKVTGYLEPYKKRKNDEDYDFRLKANNIELEENKWDIKEISEEDKKKIREISQRDDVFEYLSKSLAYEEIKNARLQKKAYLVWLLGRSRNFGNLHVLCIGDPGTGKSHLARYVEENFGKVIKAVATGATEVGLTASVVKDDVTGEFTAEGGSIPMADEGFHITDEIDELEKEYYSAFNEALSDQSITLAKANIHTEISADVAEFSVGNPKGYTFDDYEEKFKQIPIEKDDLISRYGLILGIESNSNEDEESVEKEAEKVRHILDRGDESNFDDEDYLEEELLIKYIYYAQRVYPVISEKAKRMIEESYIKLFKSQSSDNSFVKPRHANALAILSLAFAKMELADEVQESHVQKAFEFFNKCYSSIDFEIGKDDISELEGQNKMRLQKVKDVVAETEGKVEVQEIVERTNLNESEVEEAVEKLLSKGEFYEPQNGFVTVLS